MSLKHAILVLLDGADSSGYDLQKRFKEHLSFFWQASHQQVYKQLGQMNESGLITSTLTVQEGKPDKKVYAISELGKQELIDWMDMRCKPQKVNDSLLVKLYGGHLAKPQVLLDEVNEGVESHQKTLAVLEALELEYKALPPERRNELALPFLTLRRGILGEHAWLEWAGEVQLHLKKLTKENGS